MRTITERYAEIRDKTELDDKTDELIVECFKYKLFKEKPSKRFIEAFKDDYGHDYPIYISDLTKKMTGKLRARIRSLKKEAAFEERMRRQRARRGYADIDVWSIDHWFITTVSPMLKQLRKEHHGFPVDLLPSLNLDELSPEDSEAANARWEGILDRMIFLLDEMGAEKCSVKDPYEGRYDGRSGKLRREQGRSGEDAEAPKEPAEEKETGSSEMNSPGDFPDEYAEAEDIKDKSFAYVKKNSEYREKCKNEFFSLFSEYFWMLWD